MTKRKLTNRDLQAQETRNRIYSVASKLIIKKGFDNVTLEEISTKAGIAKGLFYHYFKSKADLINEVYRIIDSDFEKKLLDIDVDISPIDKIYFTVNTMAKNANNRGMTFTKQIYKGQLDAGTGSLFSKKRPFFNTIRTSIATLQEHGTISKEIQPDQYAYVLMAIARGVLYDWCLHKGKYDVETAMDICFRKIIFPEKESKSK